MTNHERHKQALMQAVVKVCPHYSPLVIDEYMRIMRHLESRPCETEITFNVTYRFDLSTNDLEVAEERAEDLIQQIDHDFMRDIWWMGAGPPVWAHCTHVNIETSINVL